MRGLWEKIASGGELGREEVAALLSLTDKDDLERLYAAAYRVKLAEAGPFVYLRGLVEISNVCSKDCYYCGIRRGNRGVSRFELDKEEILSCVRWAYERGYGSTVLQAGERSDAAYVDFIDDIVREIQKDCGGEFGVTLSLGEQTEETYRRWLEAGANRYLLRIETSNPDLYAKLHPPDHGFEARLACLDSLRRLGYQVGTGVMSGLPFQTVEDLAGDIMFFKERDIDMIGMGPYIVHDDTPLAAAKPDFEPESQLEIGLKMIAATRLALRDVNIASTTALQALSADGRELGLLAGGNVVMPNLTATEHRSDYQLYRGKPNVADDAESSELALRRSVEAIGETVAFGHRGDSPHFIKRMSDGRD